MEDVRCLATASNKQRCPFPRDADRLTCGRAEHRDQEAGLEATLLAELVSGNNIATPALPDMLTQILPAAEATEASTRASTPYNLLERPNGPINDYSNLNNPDGSMLGNDDIKMDIAEVKQDLRAVTTLLEKSLHESRNTIQHLDDLKVRYASHNQQIESLERGPSPQQLHHTVQQSQDMIKMMENVKKQFAESLHHTDPRTLVELKDLTTRVDALADLTKLSAKFDALNEQLAPLKTGAIEVWKDFGVKLDELFSMYSQLRIDTIQALAADGAVVEELAVELKTHMTSSPAHAEERIGGSLKSLAESYQSFKNATMQSNNTRDKRLKLVKEKVVEYRDNVDKLGGRVSELEEAVTAKFVSEAEPKTLKSSVESQGRRLETLAQQHSQDRDEFQARLEAIEQQFAATPIADNSMAQRPEPSTSRGTSVSREEQQEEQVCNVLPRPFIDRL